MKLIHAIILSLLVFSVGCTTTKPVALRDSIPIHLKPGTLFSEPSPSRCPVVIIRDSGFFGCALDAQLYVDDRGIVNFARTKSRVDLFFPPGEHTITLTCAEFGTRADYLHSFELGKRYQFRIGLLTTDRVWVLIPVTPEETE
jgi:hypothetical protein